MRRLSIILVALMWLLPLSAQGDCHFERDIAYRSSEDAYTQKMCRLDIASPSDAKGVPVIVWFHGGGLTGGRRDVPQQLLTSGCVVVGVGYRLSPHVAIADIIDDAAAATAWVFANAERYGGDASKIYVAGHSAGGYLVDMIGLDRQYLARYGCNADSLAAIVPFSGQAITHFEHRRTQGLDALQPTIDSLAPLFHLRADAPPMLIISGDRELELFGRYEESAYFWRMLQLKGHKDVTLYEVDGFDHGNMCLPGFELLMRFIKQREK